MDKYFIGIDLKHWAMIQYASHMWKRPELKVHLVDISFDYWNSYYGVEKVMTIELHKELDKLVLPHPLKKELKLAIGTIGIRIICWLRDYRYYDRFDYRTKSLYIDYLDHIQWNHLGCIDLAKTMKSIYESGLLPIKHYTWYKLCENCVEECIVDFWGTISQSEQYSEQMETIITQELGFDEPIDFLLDYWRLRMQNRLDEFVEKWADVLNGLSVDQYMFTMMMSDKNQTFTYFWNRLDDPQKKSIVASKTYRNGDLSTIDFEWHDVDYLMFWIQQKLHYGFETDLIEMFKLQHVFTNLLFWPCQDNFILALNESWSLGNVLQWQHIAREVMYLMFQEKAFLGDGSRATNWFCRLWHVKDFRATMITMISLFPVYHLHYMDLLKYIFSNQESWELKKELLEVILKTLEIINPFNSELLKIFSDEVLKAAHERQWFWKQVDQRGFHWVALLMDNL